MRGYFAQVRRAGFVVGLPAGKLTKAMVEVPSQLPPAATPSKEVVVQHLGFLGQMSKTRDINAASLGWTSDREERPREKLSTAGQRKLTALAAREGMTPDELLSRPIFARRNSKGEGREH